MILRLTSLNRGASTTRYVCPQDIARVVAAGPSAQWHGIRCYLHLFNGNTIEVAETADDVLRLITAAGGEHVR